MILITNDGVNYNFHKTQTVSNFSMNEFKCKCGCKAFKLDSKLIDLLYKMRDRVGRPIRITSGYRCPTHNTKIKGSPKSQHLNGTAADIAITGMTVDQIAKLAEEVGFDGIGKYYKSNFVHVDVRGTRSRWTD